MGWLIALGTVILILLFPLGVSAIYNWKGPRMWILAGPFRFQVYPRKAKKKKTEQKQENPEQAEKKPSAEQQPEKKGGSLRDLKPLIRVGLEFLNGLRQKMLVRRLELEVKLAGEDPCDLAVGYGAACAAMDAFLAQLDRFFRIRKRHIWIGCDFEAEQTLVYGRADLVIPLGRLLVLVIRYGIRGLREFLNYQNLRKGGTIQ